MAESPDQNLQQMTEATLELSDVSTELDEAVRVALAKVKAGPHATDPHVFELTRLAEVLMVTRRQWEQVAKKALSAYMLAREAQLKEQGED